MRRFLREHAPSIVAAVVSSLVTYIWCHDTALHASWREADYARQELCREFIEQAAPNLLANHPELEDWCYVASGVSDVIAKLENCQ